MYEPKYNLTHTILNNILKFEILKTKIECLEIEEDTRKEMKKNTKSTNLLHLGHLVGVNLTIKDAERIAEGKRLETEDARGLILTNFRNVLEFVLSNFVDTYSDIDLSVLLHINKLMVTNWKESWEAKFRTSTDKLDLSYDNWGDYYDETLNTTEIQDEIVDLLNWYKANSTKIHPIIRTAIVIRRLLEIYPFVYLNKLTLVAIADYLLYKTDYTSKICFPIARNFDLYESDYMEAWKADDMTFWIEKFTNNLSNDILEIRETINSKIIAQEKSVKQPFLDLNKRQLKILRYLQTIPTVKREDYIQMMDVSTMTAYRDLMELVKKKLLKIEGVGRGTKYKLANR